MPLADLPFDQRAGIIPNDHGRVIDPATSQPIPGEYVVGWIKRGPSGIIGTNKPDSGETVNMVIEDLAKLPTINPSDATPESVEKLIKSRKPDYVSYDDWLLLDQLEQSNGQASERPRIKFSRIPDMLSALDKLKSTKVSDPSI